MADITIRFRWNRKTNRRELVIGYESEEDLLAHEHERDHRALVERLIGQPLGEDTEIIVERIEKDGAAGEAQPEPGKAKQGVKEPG
jgi:hypothetical protein